MGNGVENIQDAAERTALRRQARGVNVRSLAVAAALTAIVWAWP